MRAVLLLGRREVFGGEPSVAADAQGESHALRWVGSRIVIGPPPVGYGWSGPYCQDSSQGPYLETFVRYPASL